MTFTAETSSTPYGFTGETTDTNEKKTGYRIDSPSFCSLFFPSYS